MPTLAITILAAGQGTRMHSRYSKLLHPLAGRRLVDYPLQLAQALKPARTVLVLGYLAEQVREALGDGYEYILQEPQLGTGHAVQITQPALQGCCDEVLVLYGDTPLLRTETIEEMLRQHRQGGAAVTLLSGVIADPARYGRIVRGADGQVQAVVEYADATPEQKQIHEISSGVFAFQAPWLWEHLVKIPCSPKGEYYLPDLIRQAIEEESRVIAYQAPDPDEILGPNDRLQLAEAESIMRRRIARKHMLGGVSIVDPASTYIDDTVEIGQDTVIQPNTHLLGATHIGEECVVGPNAIVQDSSVGSRCRIFASVVESAAMEDDVDIGPFAHLRKGAYLCRHVHMGNFGEVKNSRLGPGVKMGHFSYLGDAEIGQDTNIGAGTITCNFDIYRRKNKTTIGKGVFIGSDTMLVAPVKIGEGSVTAAGSVVTRDVPPHSLAMGVPAKVVREIDLEEEGKS